MWDTATTMWDASFPAIFLKFSFSFLFHSFFFLHLISPIPRSFSSFSSFSFTIESSSLVHPRFKPVLPCHLLDYAPCDGPLSLRFAFSVARFLIELTILHAFTFTFVYPYIELFKTIIQCATTTTSLSKRTPNLSQQQPPR